MEHLPQFSQPYCLLNDHVFDPIEFLLPGERQAFRQIVFVGAQHLLPHLIPQVVGFGHTGIPGQLVHDLVHHGLQRRFQIAVLLFPGEELQAIRQMGHKLLDTWIVNRSLLHAEEQLPHHLLGIPVQRIPPLGLLLIKFGQVVLEDFFGQTGLDVRDPLLGEVAGRSIRAVADHVDVRMVGLVVEGGIPPELIPGDLHGLGNLHGVSGEQAFPPLRVVVAQPGGVLPPQGNDWEPHIAGVVCDLLRHLGQGRRLIRAGEKGMGARALGAGTAGDVTDVVFFFRRRIVVVLQRPCDEVCGVAPSGCGGVVLVLEGSTAERKIPEELLHHLLLFFCSGQLGFVSGDPLSALSSRHVSDIVAQMGGNFFRAAPNVGTLENQTRHTYHRLTSNKITARFY